MNFDKKTIGMLLISALSALGTVSIVTKCSNNRELQIELKKNSGTDTTKNA